MAGVELLEHTADVGIRARGATLEEAFEQATLGLAEVLGALAPGAPDPAHDGFEPDAVLVGRPQLYGVPRIGVLERLDDRREVFLKAAWAAGSALAWRGRGTFEVQPKRRSVSHPR